MKDMSLTPGGMHRCYLSDPVHLEYASDGLCRMTGYTRDEFNQIIGECYIKLVLEEDHSIFDSFVSELAKKPSLKTVEYRIRTKDGTILWVSDTMESSLDQHGNMLGHSAVTDITHLKQQQEMLALENEQLQKKYDDLKTLKQYNTAQLRQELLSDMIPGGMVGGYIDEGFPFYFINRHMLDYLGYKTEQEYIKDINGLIINSLHPDDKERVDKDVNVQLENSNEYAVDYRMKKKDGSYIWVHNLGKSIIDEDGRDAIISVCSDITEQKNLEDRLKKANQELVSIIHNVDCGFCVCQIMGSQNLEIRYMSDSFCRLYEGTRDELLQVYNKDMNAGVHPEDMEQLATYLQKIYTIREPGEITYRCQTMKGNWKWIRMHASIVEIEDEQLMSYATYVDVTEQMRIQEKLRRNEEINDAACQFAGLWTFGYNIDKSVIYPNHLLQENFNLPTCIENFPDSFLELGHVVSDYEPEYRDAISQIQNGETQAEMVIRMVYTDGMQHWVRIRLNRLVREGVAGRYAIGTALPIDQEKAMEARLESERQKTASYDSSLLRYVIVNVTRNQVIESREFRSDIAKTKIGTTLEQALVEVGKHAYHDGHFEEYQSIYNREKLTALYNSGEMTLHIDGRHTTKDNDLMWIRNTLNLLRDPSTGDIFLYEYAYDIHTQRVQEEILRAAVNFDYERLAGLSLETHKLTRVFNRKERGSIRLRTEDYAKVYKKYCTKFVFLDDREMFLHKISLRAIQKELKKKDIYEFTHRAVENGQIRVKRNRFANYDIQNQLVLMSRNDITELVEEEKKKRLALQKSNEEKTNLLAERQQLYAALYNIIPMVISANLTQNSYEMMNYDNFYSKSAKERGVFDELIEVGATTIPNEEDRIKFVETFSRKSLIKAYENGKKKVVLEHRQLGDDGKIYWSETMVIFVKNELDNDLYEITLAQDITARKQQEQKLQIALKEAENANLAKSEFLSRMSHEIRTPMNAIMGMTSIAKDSCSDFQQIAECLDKIDLSSQYLLTLINDILEMSRIESGHMEIAHSEFDFSTLLDGIRTIVETFALKADVKFECVNCVQEENRYIGDKMRIQQILINLIGNGVKFTKSGGRVRFVAEVTSQTDIQDKLRFTISDTGIGMSEEFMKKMFQPFTQEDSKTTSKFSGSGLGLAIAKNLVKAMNGTIHADSSVGVGTTFVVEIPIEKTQQVKSKKKIDAAEYTLDEDVLKDMHVLLAEDHPLNVLVAKKILEKKGVIVTVAENGQKAVDIFHQSEPGTFQAILMDIRMPEMDGLDATRAIRALQRPDAKTIPIIAMTANALDEDRENTHKAGMNEHLAKPFEPEQLYHLLIKQVSDKQTT